MRRADGALRAPGGDGLTSIRSGWRTRIAAPDGDADIPDTLLQSFVPPRCGRCGGLMKPDVVFFGENVPAARYARARDALARADALLVAGSSLMVYSGYQFVPAAHDAGLPIAIVNWGDTRADDLCELKLACDVGCALTEAVLAAFEG